MIDYILRHWLVVLLIMIALYFINFEKETLHTLATCFIFGASALIFSGLAVYAYTKLDFVNERDTNAIARIYLATCLLFGLVVAGVQFTQFH